MSQKHDCPCAESCFLQRAMDSIGGKWKLPILCSLTANGPSRYNDLLRNVHGISNTMLSKTLKELEESGLVRRAEYLEVPVRVEYEITDRSRDLRPILMQLIQWEMDCAGPSKQPHSDHRPCLAAITQNPGNEHCCGES